MPKHTSWWFDDGFCQLPQDKAKPADIRYADLFGVVLLKRIADPSLAWNCMSFVTLAARINDDTQPYDIAGGVLPQHSGWHVVHSSTRFKTAEEFEKYREVAIE